jgi:outer membrane protein OmpA-like peptidoglycan-associated protein
MKKIFIPVILFISIGINLFGQEKSSEELKGDKYFFVYSFNKAIESYNHARQLTLDGQRKLAESYYSTDQNIKSEEIYAKLFTGSQGIQPQDYYNYSMVLKSDGKYDEAGKWMDQFAEMKPDDLRAKDYIANKDKLINLLKYDDRFKTKHLNINTDALDFGPAFYKDKIVFASTIVASGKKVKKYNWTGKPFWDMYVSGVADSQLLNPEIFDKSLNGKMHDGPASFSNEGTFMAFTRNNYHDKSKDKVVELQIYFSNYKDGKWSEPEPFVYNNQGYSVGHPCLTSDGKTMYFASDMPGGYGGADIYRTSKSEKGEWGKPENTGDKINTEGDEMFPFFEEGRKELFFASNGRFGLGGLDVFVSRLTETGFGPAINEGFPVNTQYNDYSFIVNDTTRSGYFTSDRAGGSGGDDIYSVAIVEPDVRFTIYSPENIPVEPRLRETFPLRNYIFFNLGSTDIPDRYVLLTKDQVKDFKEDQLEVFAPNELSNRSKRQLVVYYNIMNILGDRMGKDPSTSITLAGSSEKGPADGKALAESVKRYLTGVFGIDPSRLKIEGRDKPKIPSEQTGGKLELELLRQSDRRVSVESSSPLLLMEFRTGQDAPLKPVEYIASKEAPPDSNVSFNVDGANKVLSSWSLEIRDENRVLQKFGPFTQESSSIPGKSILGTRPAGDYSVTMIGQTKYGDTLKKESPVHIVLWKPSETNEMLRFSVIFEFNDSKAISIYEKYLSEIVTPKIPEGGKVIIHGHTDVIGEEAHNLELSKARANEVRGIIEKALSKAGRTDVNFEVTGYGEDPVMQPFENRFPEERFYNRTVIIDIIPPKK